MKLAEVTGIRPVMMAGNEYRRIEFTTVLELTGIGADWCTLNKTTEEHTALAAKYDDGWRVIDFFLPPLFVNCLVPKAD